MTYPANAAASYLAFSSKDDLEANNPGFNPADFNIVVPNSIRLQDVVRVSATTVSVPRVFYNITPFNNQLFWWQRVVVDTPTTPGFVFRSLNPNWVLTDSITFPVGISGIQTILDLINTHRAAILGGPDLEVWTYDNTVEPNCVKITVTIPMPANPIVFGIVPDVPPFAAVANMTWVTCGTPKQIQAGENPSGAFDLLGLRNTAESLSSFITQNNQPFDPADPNTFGSFNGVQVAPLPPYPSNLAGLLKIPLFEADVFDYNMWATTNYATPQLLPPNFAGPLKVYITISDLGDLSTVYAKSGTNYDVIAAVNLTGVPPLESAFKEVKDGEYESVGLKQPRNITGFHVRILDERFQQCFLPANYPLVLRLQVVYISR